ncbi:MAG: HU family DNA-binding protein [Deltaproteobacteria bacterium]|nr:HU family DNA-binding protein [Deltaproteobacteria bacterium]
MTKDERKPLTRLDLIDAVRKRIGLSAEDASNILEDVVDAISEVLQSSGRFVEPELGRFFVKHTPARPGRNPKTGSPAIVPAKLKPSFIMNRRLRDKMKAQWTSDKSARQTTNEATVGDLSAAKLVTNEKDQEK